MSKKYLFGLCLPVLLCFVDSISAQQTANTNSARELAGLWEAKRRFGPDVRGSLLIKQTGGEWMAEIAGRVVQAKTAGDSISFELSGGQGKFQGKFDARRAKIIGHWIQPAVRFESGIPYASPVTLVKDKQNIWRGEVSPLEMTLTFYLMVRPREDGSVGAFLKNPERNLGWTQYRADQIEREGESIKLLAANKGSEKGRVLAEGKYDAGRETMSIYFASRGGTFDFRRVDANEMSDFYPRGRPSGAAGTYRYVPPAALDDGWQTASLEVVDISRGGIEKFIQMLIDTPVDSVNSPAVHGILIARRGKLVLEEYFFGEHREKAHDTRSASKSVAADLVGARFLPRDFMKLAQVHVGGGVWNGRRIFTPEWSRRATSLLYEVKGYTPPEPYKVLRYGYLWWVIEYPYNGRTIRAFFAGGNGGQAVMGIPELDLVVAIYAGNYADRQGRQIQQAYVPKYILPAIDK